MNTIKVEEITADLIKVFNLKLNDSLYSLELENKNIGYGIIRDNKKNKIEIYILKQYQGNGYGTKLFKELLKVLNEEIIMQLELEKTIMRRIIEKNNGIEISRDGQNITYVIPKINKEVTNEYNNLFN